MSRIPPDCLIPMGWLFRLNITEEEISAWIVGSIATKVTFRGGAEFLCFLDHQRPIKFNEISKLIQEARKKHESNIQRG